MREIERNHRRNNKVKNKWGRGLLIFDAAAWKLPPNYATPPYEDYEEPWQAPRGFRGLLWSLVQKFSAQSSVHGIPQIFASTTGRKERIFWSLAFMSALLLLIFVSLLIAERYNEKKFKTTVDTTQFPVYRIPFPEVTLCNQNRLNWARLASAKRRFLHFHHQTRTMEALFADILQRYDKLTFAKFDLFENISLQAAEMLNYVNFTEVVTFMAWRCNELLVNCTWEDENFDCCEIFLPRISQLGMCLAFNTIESEKGQRRQLVDPHWPWRTAKAGPTSGLRFRVLLGKSHRKTNETFVRGVTFMITEPLAWFNFPIDVTVYTDTTVAIDADMTYYDEETRSVPSDQRECVFSDERNSRDFRSLPGHTYMFENCQAECEQQHLLHYCNCTMDLFFPPSPYPPCKLVDMLCLARHNDRLIYFEQPGEREYVHTPLRGMQCECFLNCYSIDYFVDVRSNELKPSEREAIDQGIIDMRFFFKRDWILVYKTTLIYTWIDLMVSFGGIAALFLGCSLISMFDLGYFIIFDVPVRIWQQLKARQEVSVRSLKVKESVQAVLNEGAKK